MKLPSIKLKLPSSDLIKGLLFIFILNGLRLLRMFGSFFSKPLVMIVITSLIILVCFVIEKTPLKRCNKYVKIMVFFLLMSVLFGTIKSDSSIKSRVLNCLTYAQVLLAFPIISLHSRGKLDFKRFLKTIVWTTMIAYLLRYFISYVEYFTGIQIFQGVYPETVAKGDWYRNGFMRINPPAFGNIIVAILMYLYYEEKKVRGKILYIFFIFLSVFYSYRIHASRSVLLYQAIEIILIIAIHNRTALRKIVMIIVASSALVIAVAMGVIDQIFASFSISNVQYGYSTYSRLLSVSYYGAQFLQNPITGTGFISSENQRFLNYSSIYTLAGGDIADIGFLYTIVQLGFFSVVFYIMFFYRSYVVGRESRIIGRNNLDILAWGIGISILITGINIDLFYSVYVFSAPFCVAIIEMIFQENKKQRRILK